MGVVVCEVVVLLVVVLFFLEVDGWVCSEEMFDDGGSCFYIVDSVMVLVVFVDVISV